MFAGRGKRAGPRHARASRRARSPQAAAARDAISNAGRDEETAPAAEQRKTPVIPAEAGTQAKPLYL
jgi:hypothetical protein